MLEELLYGSQCPVNVDTAGIAHDAVKRAVERCPAVWIGRREDHHAR